MGFNVSSRKESSGLLSEELAHGQFTVNPSSANGSGSGSGSSSSGFSGNVSGSGSGTGSRNGSGGLRKQYFSDPTRAYAAQYGDIADNVYAARCQGLDESDFFAWQPILIRSANTEFTGYANSRPDDTQRIYVLKPENVTELHAGALVEYGNNLWMVFRTRNLGVPHGSAILRRCNALTNVVMGGTSETGATETEAAETGTAEDEESTAGGGVSNGTGTSNAVTANAVGTTSGNTISGNTISGSSATTVGNSPAGTVPQLVSVPLVLESTEIASALPYVSNTDSLAAGTLRCYCQRCPATEQWQENTRIILGRSAFLIRGLNDFTREQTNNRTTARVLSFTLSRTSPLPVDSIEQQCADYHLYFE